MTTWQRRAASTDLRNALLAPTEVLAEQHFTTIADLLQVRQGPLSGPGVLEAQLSGLDRPFTLALLTGSAGATSRRSVLERLAQGKVDLLIGTHAIIQDGVDIPNLELAIADEQHRFGVEQRAICRRPQTRRRLSRCQCRGQGQERKAGS